MYTSSMSDVFSTKTEVCKGVCEGASAKRNFEKTQAKQKRIIIYLLIHTPKAFIYSELEHIEICREAN